MLPARPLFSLSMEALARTLLFSLGLDHALIDFILRTAIAAVNVVLRSFV